jgi:hypothetical protein
MLVSAKRIDQAQKFPTEPKPQEIDQRHMQMKVAKARNTETFPESVSSLMRFEVFQLDQSRD